MPALNVVYPPPKTQDDIVKQKTGGSGLIEKSAVQRPVGLLQTISNLPNTEVDLAQTLFNAMRSYPPIQCFKVVFGTFDNVQLTTVRFPAATQASKKELSEALARQIATDDTVVGVELTTEGKLTISKLKDGDRSSETIKAAFDPRFEIDYTIIN